MIIYQVDAFTDRLFSGNPAAVVPLGEAWLPDATLQTIAAENNLSETAFFVAHATRPGYHLRWFTPTVEVRFCGHATLASAHVLFQHMAHPLAEIEFHTRELGTFRVRRDDDLYRMNFPADELRPVTPPAQLVEGLRTNVLECWKGRDDYFAVLPSEEMVRSCAPDFSILRAVEARGVVVTAPGREVDFVSRGFFPQTGVDEDPVTGSANTSLTSLWSQKLGKTELSARQLSQRGGELWCTDLGERIEVAGRAVTYLRGEIFLP